MSGGYDGAHYVGMGLWIWRQRVGETKSVGFKFTEQTKISVIEKRLKAAIIMGKRENERAQNRT